VFLWTRIRNRLRQRRLQRQFRALAAQGQRQAQMVTLCARLTMESLPGTPPTLLAGPTTPASLRLVASLGTKASVSVWRRLSRRHQDKLLTLVFHQVFHRLSQRRQYWWTKKR
jgi:hypothetical protein